jgi:hypothetical protein
VESQRQADDQNAAAIRAAYEKAAADRLEAARMANEQRQRELDEKAKLRGIVSGAAWLVRDNGSSDVQRSLHVLVVRRMTGRQPVATILQGQAQYEQEQSKESLDNSKSFDSSPDIKKRYTDEAQAHARRSRAALALVASLPAQMEMKQAYEFCKKNAEMMSFATCPESEVVAQGKTDIPTGDYYLYPRINTKVLSAEWLLPIHVEGNAQKIDLDNDNASESRGG